LNKTSEELCDFSAVDALRHLENGDISALELFDSWVKRIELVNPSVNAMVATDFDADRAQTKSIDQSIAR